jgi:hypothetical protein
MTQTFETSEAFSHAIDSTLTPSASSDQLRAALVAGIDKGEARHRAQSQSTDGALNLRIGNWVLRTQDTPVIELIGIVAAAATAAVVPGAVLALPIITAVSCFATLAWNTWRKGASLTRAETAVLGFITVHAPISEPDLLSKMHGTLCLTDTEITNALKTLQQVMLRNGSIVPLIRKDAADQWRPQLN